MSIEVRSSGSDISITASGVASAMALLNIFISAKFIPDPTPDRLFSPYINEVLEKCIFVANLVDDDFSDYIKSYRSSSYWSEVDGLVDRAAKDTNRSKQELWSLAIYPATADRWAGPSNAVGS